MSTLILVGAASGASQILVEEGVDTLHDAVAQASPGDTLVLRPGLYEVTHTVLIDKDLTIRGSTKDPADAHVVAVDADEFNFQESEPPFDVETNRGHIFFVNAGATKVSFAYLTVKNAPESPPFDNDEGACVEEPPFGLGLNLTECFGDGIHADGAAQVKVDNVQASLNAGNGIYVNAAVKAEFSNILAVNNGAFGIDVDTALALSVRRSTFTGNQISGMEASGHEKGTARGDYTADVVIEGTQARGNGEIGIEVERFDQATLKAVICADNREDGFDADRVSQVSISQSSFINNLDDGMELFPVGVPPDEQPADLPGNIIEIFDRLTFAGNVGEDVNHPPTEN